MRGPGAQPRFRLAGGELIRPWETADAPVLVLADAEPLVRHYAGRLIEDRGAALAAVHSWADRWQEGVGATWAVCSPAGDPMGHVGFAVTDPTIGTGAVGYWLFPEARGRGLMSGALAATVPLVFRTLSWHRMELYHAVENSRSCAVARRAGFQLEGTMREAMRYPADGRRSDEHLHARLAHDPPPG
jgi:RimJ/RimL family protein N-acetyltransferase